MRVLVTGASGFVGSRLARLLAERGHRVVGTYIHEPVELPGVEPREADLRRPDEMARLVSGFAPEAVLHLAGLSHVGASWSRMDEYFEVNVLGTESLLRASAGARVVVASSAEVYGLVPEGSQPIVEDRRVAPRSPYALTKAAMERLALDREALVVRSFNAVGSGQSPNFALPAFAAQLAAIARGEQEPILRVGNLEARRDFLHVDDAARAYAVVLERGEPGEVYNLGGGEVLSIAEALERLIAISGVSCEIVTDPDRLRPADLPLLRADATRLRGLGWAPEKGLDEALTELWLGVVGERVAAP